MDGVTLGLELWLVLKLWLEIELSLELKDEVERTGVLGLGLGLDIVDAYETHRSVQV
jgi:hypothetical protein